MQTPYISRAGHLGTVLFLSIAAGCATAPERIARYIEKHPDRPPAICAALSKATVTEGMTPKEVRLCLGAPNRIDHAGTEQAPTETWLYFQDRDKERDSRSSSFWSLDVPKATLYFSADGFVTEVVFFSVVEKQEQRPEQQPEQPSHAPQPQTRPTRPRSAPAPQHYNPKPDELGTKGWPKLTLSGLSVIGDERSAILNDDVLAPGEMVNGVKVTDVYANGVLLEYRGTRAFLRRGETTE